MLWKAKTWEDLRITWHFATVTINCTGSFTNLILLLGNRISVSRFLIVHKLKFGFAFIQWTKYWLFITEESLIPKSYKTSNYHLSHPRLPDTTTW